MGNESAAVRANVKTIYDDVTAQAPGSKVGLVGYGSQPNHHGNHLSHIHTVLTENRTEFQAAADSLVASGGAESGYEAIAKTVERNQTDHIMGFRQKQGFCIVIITDEPSNSDPSGYTESRAEFSLFNFPVNEANATGFLFAIIPLSSTQVKLSYDSLVHRTGGQWFDLSQFTSNPQDVLKSVITLCNVAINRISLVPTTASPKVGKTHTVTASVIEELSGNVVGVPNIDVTFQVLSGPHASQTSTAATDSNGEVTWSMLGTDDGIDTIEACFDDGGYEQCSSPANVEWLPPCEIELLGPDSLELTVGDPYTARANVTMEHDGSSVPGTNVTFLILAGVHSGLTSTVATDTTGQADFTITGTNVGEDELEACFDDLGTIECGTVNIKWLALNKPPVAICKDAAVSVSANESCEGCVTAASINHGSTDEEDEDATLKMDLNETCPFVLGSTPVTLTVEDSEGEVDTCEAMVIVQDTTPPTASCNAPSTITPPDTPISFAATATDNCLQSSAVITGYDCFKFTKKNKRVDKRKSCQVVIVGDTITILESGGVNNSIEWIVVAVDESGNMAEQLCHVDVVKPAKSKSSGSKSSGKPSSAANSGSGKPSTAGSASSGKPSAVSNSKESGSISSMGKPRRPMKGKRKKPRNNLRYYHQ